MTATNEDGPPGESWIYWACWAILWVFLAICTLMCLFGCMLYNWEGNG